MNVAGIPIKHTITRIRYTVTDAGVFATATVGDPVGFDPDDVNGERISGVEARVSGLERNAEADTTPLLDGMRLGAQSAAPFGADPDEYTDSGIYHLASYEANMPKNPFGSNPVIAFQWDLHVVRDHRDRVRQTATTSDTNQAGWEFVRERIGSTWTDWRVVSSPSTSYTPTLRGGATVGNGTLEGSCSVHNGLLMGSFVFTLGSTSAITGDLSFDRPLPPATTMPYAFPGRIAQGGSFYPTQVLIASGRIWVRLIDGERIRGLSSSLPGSWSAGHKVEATFTYPII